MNPFTSRRNFLRTTALTSAACAMPGAALAATGFRAGDLTTAVAGSPPIKLGLASYTFRNFARAQMIGFMKQLDVSDLNAKDIKDHLPTDPALEDAAIAEYNSANIPLHAVGAIYFPKDEDADIRAKFDP